MYTVFYIFKFSIGGVLQLEAGKSERNLKPFINMYKPQTRSKEASWNINKVTLSAKSKCKK